MADTASRAERFNAAEQAERGRPGAHQPAPNASVDCVCPDEVERTHFYLGLHWQVAQYQIGTRDLSLRIQTVPLPARDPEPFQKQGTAALPVSTAHWDMADVALHARTVSPPAESLGYEFNAVITHASQGLKSERLIPGYELESQAEPRLNALLGHALAFQVLRSLTVPHFGSGDFERECVGPPTTILRSTEIVGVQLLVFLRAKLNGRIEIRKMINGQIAGVVSQADYDREKRADVNRHDGEHSGPLNLVPNAYTITVLVQDLEAQQPGRGQFELVEVYCDGDCLWGADDA